MQASLAVRYLTEKMANYSIGIVFELWNLVLEQEH